MNYGAAPDDWLHFDLWLGLGEDLLPVVSNPTAEISELSKMKGLGKTPSRYNAERKVIGIPDWTTKRATPAEVDRWAKEPDYGICIQTRRVRALDIDVEDPVAADRLRCAIRAGLGDLPCRSRAGSGKALLLLRVADDTAATRFKRSFRCEGGLVEFLAEGQQCVAVGTHTSGSRYQWAAGLPDSIPEVSAEDFEALWQALVDRFAVAPESRATQRRRDSAEGAAIDDSVADWLREHGHVLDEGRDGALYIACPWQDEHSGDSGVTETAWFPAGGGYEQGHFKCLHAHCDSRTDDEFLDFHNLRAADFESLPAEIPAADAPARVDAPRRLVRDGKGAIESTIHNLVVALEASDWTGTDIAFDTFRADVMVSPHGKEEWRSLADNDYTRLRLWLERKSFKPIGRELMRDALHLVADAHQFDSAQIWLNGLAWDGVPRVERFLTDYFGASPTPYAEAVSRYWWTAHAGRVVEPGCQCDMVPILVGDQGAGKSQAVKAMVPAVDHYIEVNLEHKDPDLSRKMRGALVGELGELRGLLGRSAEANKAWVTSQFEEWTPKYMERSTRLMRRLVFVGTTNRDDFLGDSTGERRWLPIGIGAIDIDAIRRDAVQLWAEARVLFEAGGVAWRDAFELAKAEHAAFKQHDVWEDAVARWLATDGGQQGGQDGFTIEDAFLGALGGDNGKRTLAEQHRLGNVLRAIGCTKRRVRTPGERRKLWFVASGPLRPPANDNLGGQENRNDYNALA